jgi:hypothetical protein
VPNPILLGRFLLREGAEMDRYEDDDEIECIARGFADCTLPCAEWTHRAHLTVGLWYAREYEPDEALDRVRAGIRRYNTACGTENSATHGYHETITRFYMGLISTYLTFVADRSDWVAVTNRFIERFGDRQLPLRYYTRERLMSSEARLNWLPPDIRSLDSEDDRERESAP